MNTPSNEKPLFKLEKINYTAGGKQILSDISFAIPINKFCLITGPSGSGKSTLIKIMANLISPTSGKIYYKTEEIESMIPCAYRSKAVLVGQKAFVIDGTVRENLMLPFSLKANRDKSSSEKNFFELFQDIGLNKNFIDKDSSKLSGGENQRMALVRGAALEPETLLLDEPSASLDISSEEKVINFLKKLKHSISLVVVAHSTAYLEVVDLVVILKNGRLKLVTDKINRSELKKYLDEDDE